MAHQTGDSKTHLANLPIYYEYKADGNRYYRCRSRVHILIITKMYGICTSTTQQPIQSSSAQRLVMMRLQSLFQGQAVFYQNGTWAYADVSSLGDDNLGMLPIYIGVDGEENQGLCTGSENYWCVNAKAFRGR